MPRAFATPNSASCLNLLDGAFRALSWLGDSAGLRGPITFDRHTFWRPETEFVGQLALTKQTVQLTDARTGRPYADKEPNRMAAVDLGGVRTARLGADVKGR